MKSIVILLAAAGSLALATSAMANEELAKAKGCLGCHTVAEKKVGPALKDVAAKYKGNKEAEATLITKLKEGKGHMKVSASDAELKTLVQWTLTAK